MEFTFDEREKGKLTVNAVAGLTPYQLEISESPSIDLKRFKEFLLSKKFELISKTP